MTSGVNAAVESRGSRRLVLGLCVLLSVSMGFNAWLVRSLTNAQQAARPPILAAGTWVPPIPARELGSERTVTIAYGDTDRPTVLYLFSPQCGWCGRNLESIKTLVEKRKNAYRFVGISLSDKGLREYVAAQALPFPVYSGLSQEILKTYRVTGTPHTIIVSPDGRVVQTWGGAYLGQNRKQLQAYFKVALPELSTGHSS